MKLEEQTHKEIDAQLTASGWVVQTRAKINTFYLIHAAVSNERRECAS